MTDTLDDVARRQAIMEALRRWGSVKRSNRVVAQAPARALESLHRVMGGLFDQQKAVVADPNKRKAIFGTRRMGKTSLYAPWFTQAALDCRDCEATMFIIGPTLEHAKALLWRPLENLNKQYNIGLDLKADPARCIFPNGVHLYFRGAKDKEQLGVLRGFKTPFAAVDEAQDIRDHLLQEIDTALSAGMRDFGGTLAFSGTPGRVPVGLWYDITTGALPNWTVHQWSLLDNPFLSDEAKNIEAILRDEGLTPDSPRFKREYLGLWVEDSDELVYAWDFGRNGISEVNLSPEVAWHYVIGVDFGFNDATAVIVGAFSFESDTYYEVDEFAASGLTISDFMTRGVMPMVQKYSPMRIVADAQAKQMIEEINQRWGIGMQRADKPGKLAFIEIMNSDMMLKRIKTPVHFKLVEERQRLVWDPHAKPKLEEHPRRPNNRCDAALYAYREAKHWIGRDVKKTQTFTDDNQRQAYWLKQYILQRATTQAPKADWANDNDFFGD